MATDATDAVHVRWSCKRCRLAGTLPLLHGATHHDLRDAVRRGHERRSPLCAGRHSTKHVVIEQNGKRLQFGAFGLFGGENETVRSTETDDREAGHTPARPTAGTDESAGITNTTTRGGTMERENYEERGTASEITRARNLERERAVPERVAPGDRTLYERGNELRRDIKDVAERANLLREDAKQASADAKGEAIANTTLAFRHLEDASMRLGKMLQALDGGASVYDRQTTVGA